MKLFFLAILCLFFSFFALGQIPSMMHVEVKTSVWKNGKILASKTKKETCFIEKNEKIDDLKWKDTMVWKIRNKDKVPRRVFEFCQKANISFELKETTILAEIKPDFEIWSYQPALPSRYKDLIKAADFNNHLAFDFYQNNSQTFDYQLDSFSVKQKITLRMPSCMESKWSSQNGGIVTVYYRAAREHLNKTLPSSSSASKTFDWGHAFIGVKDLKTNQLYFLDGWPDGKLEEGQQHFVWNEKVEESRTADHHSISFSISAAKVAELRKLIAQYRTACIAYEVLDFNCTDATRKVLEKIGYYTIEDKHGTILPNSFANTLMEKLNKKKVCYEFDGFRIR